METWVIKLPQADQPDEPILIRVSRKAGGQKLDLDLLATDGESAWRTKVRQRKLDGYRAENYEGTPEEWSSILRCVFVFPPDVVLPPATRDSLETICKRSGKGSKSSLGITLQARVEDIERRLGIVELASADTDDVDLFSWTVQAVGTRDDISAKFAEKESRLEEAEKKIESLKNHVNELLAAKEEHETQLLSKFTLLLNEKKLRIRTQQRQIAEADRPARSSASTRSSKASRKRKQDARQQTSDASEESEGFDVMNVDEAHDDQDDRDSDQDNRDSDQARTPSDAETDAGDDDDDDDDNPTRRSAVGRDQMTQNVQSATLPPRNPAFENRSKGSAAEPENPKDISMNDTAADNDETASEDDEL